MSKRELKNLPNTNILESRLRTRSTHSSGDTSCEEQQSKNSAHTQEQSEESNYSEIEEFTNSTTMVSKEEVEAMMSELRREITTDYEYDMQAMKTKYEQEINLMKIEILTLKTKTMVEPQAVMDALRSVRLSAITTNVNKPRYNPRRMTADSFLTECERYLKSLQHDEKNFVDLIKTILTETEQSWYSHVGHKAKDWDDFKQMYKNRFETWHEQDLRLSELKNRKQQIFESTETFIYQMIDLAKNCFPTETEAQLVRHAQQALHPSLGAIIGADFKPNAAELIQTCQQATRIVQSQNPNDFYKKVPPMTDFDRNSRQRGKPKSNNQTYNQTNPSPPKLQFESTANGRGKSRRGRGRFHARGGFNRNFNNKPQMGSRNTEGNLDQQPSTSAQAIARDKARQMNPSAKQRKCLKCGGQGHIAKQCATKVGYSMTMYAEDDSDYSDSQQKDLNSSGRT